MKIILTLSFLVISLFADDYSSLLNNKLDVSQFSNMQPSASIGNDMTEHFTSKIKDMTYAQAKTYIDTMFIGDKFLSKDEAYILLDKLYNIKNDEKTKAHTFLLYFFTKDVPLYSISNVLLELSVLQDEKIDIQSKLYLKGPTDDFEQYMMSAKDYIMNYPIEYQSRIGNNFHLKFEHDFFTAYHIEKAPAMALAFCSSEIPSIETCNIPYIIRGDTSLHTFIHLISIRDKNYKQFDDILNNIVKKSNSSSAGGMN